jgi:TRAP-type mannitol/chloroaromatic compound transport system permease small subunit
MQAVKTFIRVVGRVSDIVGLCVSVLMPAMVAVLALEVVHRYLFHRPTIWTFDIAVFMFGYIGCLSGAYVMKRREHINVDLVYSLFSPRGRAVLDVCSGLLFFFFMVLVVVYCWKAGVDAFVAGDRTSTEWGPPLSHFKLVIPIGGFLLLLQGMANWLTSLYLAFTGRELDL